MNPNEITVIEHEVIVVHEIPWVTIGLWAVGQTAVITLVVTLARLMRRG
jgi:hypothetical protein